jgi:glyoxylase-like metal-dependent hydrolase (beta-lactamase superfamily II)
MIFFHHAFELVSACTWLVLMWSVTLIQTKLPTNLSISLSHHFMSAPALPDGFCFFERGWLSCNTLLIHDSDHAVIFDTGYFLHATQLHRLILSQISSQPVDLIVNSHLHSDHCGGNFFLQHAYDQVGIQIPTGQFSDVMTWNTSALTYQGSGQTCPRFKPNRHLTASSTLITAGYEWQIHAAPGHDNDEFIFFEPENRILFSADALWESGLGVVFPEFLGGVGFENVAQTLDLIESLNPQVVLPGHGSAFVDAHQAIGRVHQRLEQFTQHPETHAHYSAKVLLKFRLLEIQKSSLHAFIEWATNVELFQLIHERFFSDLELSKWLSLLIDELITRNAAIVRDKTIFNQ